MSCFEVVKAALIETLNNNNINTMNIVTPRPNSELIEIIRAREGIIDAEVSIFTSEEEEFLCQKNPLLINTIKDKFLYHFLVTVVKQDCLLLPTYFLNHAVRSNIERDVTNFAKPFSTVLDFRGNMNQA